MRSFSVNLASQHKREVCLCVLGGNEHRYRNRLIFSEWYIFYIFDIYYIYLKYYIFKIQLPRIIKIIIILRVVFRVSYNMKLAA